MLILPPQTSYILPKQLQDIMTNDDLGCSQYYPIDFRLDVTVGGKTQYSEAILPEIEEELLLDVVKFRKCFFLLVLKSDFPITYAPVD